MSLNTASQWREYFEDLGLRKPLINQYLKYISPLLSNGVPIVFSRKHLASLLGKTEPYLRSVTYGTESHYREFHIPKRTGGRRLIAAPYPALLECQQWVSANVLSAVSTHRCAHGYIKGRSILSNVEPHAHAAMVLKMDLTDFFPSISLRRVIHVFRSFGYADDVSFVLGRICTLNEKLPQGAATSPMLSNIIARRLDGRLEGLARKFLLTYSRYADDLVFSGENIPLKFQILVMKIVQSEGFEVNNEKTKLMSGPGRRIVTGLQINDEVRVPRKFRRDLRKEVYFIERFGYRSHVSKLRKPYSSYIYSIRGRAAFLHWVEKDSENASRTDFLLRNLSISNLSN